MAKLILSLDGAYVSEYMLTMARTTIGRRSSNDIHLDNLAISGDHAVIIKKGNDFYVEDLDSTNGTLVNNESVNTQPTKKHLLKHGDVMEFGKFQLKYLDDTSDSAAADNSAPAFEKTMLIHPSALKLNKPKSISVAAETQASGKSEQATVAELASATTPVVGRIQVLNGSSSGRELVLNKALTTLGKTGVQVAVITRRPNGYFITHVEGQVLPIVNGVLTGAQAFSLSDHDVIELAGVKMEFYLTRP